MNNKAMVKSVARAFKGYLALSKAARIFGIARSVALGCAAAALIAGGVITFLRLRGKG
ncbi:MAG: hypothetical protein LBB75_01950 [Oscillospiraceae bacterium]|jgi:hypothetical protein|nr:hypothetical protein [Oscillospiraceae bacterium]